MKSEISKENNNFSGNLSSDDGFIDYRSLFENLPGLYLVLNPEFKILQASDAYNKATFTKREDITGKYVFDVFPGRNETDNSARPLMKSLQFVVKNKKSHSMGFQRYDLSGKDGGFIERYWSPVNIPVLTAEGNIKYIIHRVEDITDFVSHPSLHSEDKKGSNEHKLEMEIEIMTRAEDMRRVNEELELIVEDRTKELRSINKNLADYKFALDASSIVVITDREGTIIHVNDNFCRTCKYNRDELIGSSHRMLNSGYHSKEFFRTMWDTVSSGKIWRGELRNKAKDGSFYWVDTVIIPFLDNTGKPNKYLAIRSNITDRVVSQQNLKASEENYRSLYENTIVALITVDIRSLKPVMVNETAARLFGYSSVADFLEYFDPTFHFIEHSDSIETWIHVWKGEGRESQVQQLKRIDGRAFWAKVFLNVNASGELAHCVVIDITHQIQTTEKLEEKVKELEKVNKELESFTFISSHDLQEPLRKVRNFVSVLLATENSNLSLDGQHYLKRLSETSQKMQLLIEDLLIYSRTRNATREFKRSCLDELIMEVLKEFAEQIRYKNAIIDSGHHCRTNVIPFQFRQLISNLISNSLKFSAPARQLRINILSEISFGHSIDPLLLPDKKYCHLRYSDNGIGFDPKYNERIFEIFERLNSSDLFPGTGMGLAICRRIAENHDGMIKASGQPDKGVIFDVYLAV